MEVLVQWQRIQKIKTKTKIKITKIEMKTIIKIKTTIIMKIVDSKYMKQTLHVVQGLFHTGCVSPIRKFLAVQFLLSKGVTINLHLVRQYTCI